MDSGTHTPETAGPATNAGATAEAKPKRAPRARPSAMVLTPAAVERVKALLGKRGKPSAGIRIGVKTKG